MDGLRLIRQKIILETEADKLFNPYIDQTTAIQYSNENKKNRKKPRHSLICNLSNGLTDWQQNKKVRARIEKINSFTWQQTVNHLLNWTKTNWEIHWTKSALKAQKSHFIILRQKKKTYLTNEINASMHAWNDSLDLFDRKFRHSLSQSKILWNSTHHHVANNV